MTITYHDEDWRVVADFPDYAVSNYGQIKRVKVDALGHKLTGRPLKAMISKSGYAKVSLCRDARVFNARVNRIVCAAFHGPAPSPGHHAAHNDGDSLNNHADNLRWVDGRENERDKRAHGTAAIGERHWSKLRPDRRAKGEKHGLAKLNADAVRLIKNDTRRQRDIANAYGVSQRAIWSIKAGKTWSHVS